MADTLQLLKKGIEFAKQNPDSPQAIELRKRIEAGMYRNELAQLKQQSSVAYVPPKERNIFEKVAGFIGGEKIAQGLAQTIANPIINKNIKETQRLQDEAQFKLIQQIQKNKAEGKDNTKLIEALKASGKDINDLAQGYAKLTNQDELTVKQVLGDALQLGTTIVGAGSLPSVAKKVVTPTGFVKGAIQGAKTGAISGGAFGVSTGVSQALKDDKDLKDIAISGAMGGLGGAITGGLVGGAIGGVSGGIRQSKLNKENKYLDAITPNAKELTPTEYEDLLNRGRISPKTKTQPAKYILSDAEKNVAKKYKDIFTNDPVKNTDRLIEEIAKKDADVGNFLKNNNKNFNVNSLKKSIEGGLKDISDVSIPENRIEKLKKTMINNFVKGLKKNDMESLWIARKEFDRQIEKAFSGSPTLQNTIKKEFRNSIQDFISQKTPDEFYKTSMKEMTQLFNLKDITNTKAIKERGMNAIQLWIKRNPTKVKVIGTIAGTGVVTTIGASLLKD